MRSSCRPRRWPTEAPRAQDERVQLRLETLDPQLVARMREAGPQVLLEIARKVAEFAVATAQLTDADVEAGLAVLAKSSQLEPGDLHDRLVALAARLDDQAFDVMDRVDAGLDEYSRYENAFAQARAASAVAAALTPDCLTAALETVYEGQAAVGSLEDLHPLIDQSF